MVNINVNIFYIDDIPNLKFTIIEEYKFAVSAVLYDIYKIDFDKWMNFIENIRNCEDTLIEGSQTNGISKIVFSEGILNIYFSCGFNEVANDKHKDVFGKDFSEKSNDNKITINFTKINKEFSDELEKIIQRAFQPR